MPVAFVTPRTMGTRSGSSWASAVRTRSRGVTGRIVGGGVGRSTGPDDPSIQGPTAPRARSVGSLAEGATERVFGRLPEGRLDHVAAVVAQGREERVVVDLLDHQEQ